MNKQFRFSLFAAMASVSIFFTRFTFAIDFAFTEPKDRLARHKDSAFRYILRINGDFFRVMKNNGKACQIADKVQNFEIPAHSKDSALVYFKKDGDLWLLKRDSSQRGNCPPANSHKILEKVENFSLVSNSQSSIFSFALSSDGNFIFWDKNPPFEPFEGFRDFVLNECFSVRGKSFNSFVAFAISNEGIVMKIDGRNPASSSVDRKKTYSDLAQFKNENLVCAEEVPRSETK